MRTIFILIIFCIIGHTALAQDGILSFQPLVNDVSVYKNFLDTGSDAGQTLQII